MRCQKRRNPAGPSRRVSPYAVTSTGPEVHQGGPGHGSRLPINNLTKLVPALGSSLAHCTPLQCSLAVISGTGNAWGWGSQATEDRN
jgi:hypothetical protein